MGESVAQMRIRSQRQGALLSDVVQRRRRILQIYAGFACDQTRLPHRRRVRRSQRERSRASDTSRTEHAKRCGRLFTQRRIRDRKRISQSLIALVKSFYNLMGTLIREQS